MACWSPPKWLPTIARLHDPGLAFGSRPQVLQHETLGDHRLAVGVGANQHQPFGAQHRRPLQQLLEAPMRGEGGVGADPARGAELGDALRQRHRQDGPHMFEKMLGHSRHQLSIGNNRLARAGWGAGGSTAGSMIW